MRTLANTLDGLALQMQTADRRDKCGDAQHAQPVQADVGGARQGIDHYGGERGVPLRLLHGENQRQHHQRQQRQHHWSFEGQVHAALRSAALRRALSSASAGNGISARAWSTSLAKKARREEANSRFTSAV